MKSKIVTDNDYVDEKDRYSDLMVLQSAAGYYIGTLYTSEDGFVEPGSRDSGYFRTSAEAGRYLKMLSEVINPGEYMRDQP